MNELFEIADEFSVFRDGKYIGTHASERRHPRRHHPHDGRPRDHPDVPQGGGADRRGRAVGQGPASRASSTTSRSTCAPARSSASPAWSARAARNVAETIFGVTPATSRHDRDQRQAGEIASPTQAMRHGMAFLTEDRKETGCFLILDVLENMQIAVLQDTLRQGRLRRRRGGVDRALRGDEPNAAGQDAEPARARSTISPAATSRRC